MWNPDVYLRFAGERSRPFVDLVARIDATEPATVVDLGCGPGTLTVQLASRWPKATVVGLDSSAEMITAARSLGAPVRFAVADVVDWHASEVDVVVASAVLQWVPGHDQLLARWVGELPAGATLAFQVPGNFDAPSHRALHEVAALPRWRGRFDGMLRGTGAVSDAVHYAQRLTDLGCSVDAWETTYVHRLPVTGDDHPVLRWVDGTALRGLRAVVDDEDWTAIRAELTPRLADAYPIHSGLVWFPFRRIFVVARR